MKNESTVVERIVTTTESATLSRYWMVSALIGLLFSSVAGLLVSLERIDLSTASIFSTADDVFQFWTAHRVALVLIAVLPLMIGLATAIVPRQVGASRLVFPRMSAFSFWVWLFGALIIIIGFLANGGVGTPEATSETQSVALTLVGVLLAIIGICGASTSVLTTIVAGRAPGISLINIPAFSWSVLVAGTMWLATLPVLVANTVLVYVDMRGRAPVNFGSEAVVWEQLSWAFTHPQVYLWVLPLLGIVAEIISAAFKNKISNPFLFTAIGLTGAAGFGAYAQTYFDIGTPVFEEAFSIIQAFIAIPAVLLVVAFISPKIKDLKGFDKQTTTPAVLATLSIVLLLHGVVVGAVHVIGPLELATRSTVSAQIVLTLGAGVLACMAAFSWWGELLIGKSISQRKILISGLTFHFGVGIFAVADFLVGFTGQNDFTGVSEFAAGTDGSSWVETLNVISFIGSLLILLGVIAAIATTVQHVLSKTPATGNPWGVDAPEWKSTEKEEVA